MQYRVKRTCYFNNRLYEKGEMVTLEGSVPEHFSPLPGQVPVVEPVVVEPVEVKQLEDMTVAELKKLAADNGIEIKSNKKTELIAAIRGE